MQGRRSSRHIKTQVVDEDQQILEQPDLDNYQNADENSIQEGSADEDG